MAPTGRADYSSFMPASSVSPEAAMVQRARLMLLGSAAVTFALFMIPYGEYIAYPLLLISTAIHELGHGVAAEISGGDFVRFMMYSDGSGVAYHTSAGGEMARAFVAAGGLCGPAVLAGAFFVAGRTPKWSRIALAGFGAALLLAMLLVVRNGFGLAFVGALAGLSLAIAVWGRAELSQLAIVFLAVQLALSVYSRGDYLFMQWAETGAGRMPSDSQQMAEALAGPYWMWGGMCAAFSAAVLLGGGWYFLRGTKQAAGLTVKTKVSPRPLRTAR